MTTPNFDALTGAFSDVGRTPAAPLGLAPLDHGIDALQTA